jgi:hypothetical protein
MSGRNAWEIEPILWRHWFQDNSGPPRNGILATNEDVIDFASRQTLPLPSWWPDTTKAANQLSRSPEELNPAPMAIGTSRFNRPKGEGQPSSSPEKLRKASVAMINETIRSECERGKAAGEYAPNINKMPAPVQFLLKQKGFYSSKRRIKELGGADEFKAFRRPRGQTIASERRKKIHLLAWVCNLRCEATQVSATRPTS